MLHKRIESARNCCRGMLAMAPTAQTDAGYMLFPALVSTLLSVRHSIGNTLNEHRTRVCGIPTLRDAPFAGGENVSAGVRTRQTDSLRHNTKGPTRWELETKCFGCTTRNRRGV